MQSTTSTTEQTPFTLEALLSWLRRQREQGSIHHEQQHIWQVFGYAEVERILSDPRAFSSDFSAIMPAQRDFDLFARGNFVRMDPPRHRKLRGLISQAFTPRMIHGLAHRIAELTVELLDKLGGADRFDLVDGLAHPLPVIVIAELLGIPVADRTIFRHWADTLFSQNEQTSEIKLDEATLKALFDAVAPTMREMNGYLLAHIQDRRARPANDLMTELVNAEVDGERLDDQEIVGFVGLLLIAGHITTTALLGNAIITLDEHPDTAAELRADPARLPAAIEEVLRCRPPFPRLARRAATDVDLDGHTIGANQVIVLWVASANRDGAQFPDPDRFDIHRTPNPHLAFGHGIHFCLGAPLARLESKIALGILLERYRRIAVGGDEPAEFHNPWTMISAKRLPVVVQAA
ncbi:MAG: cytochrome P450 [Burkholderiales bacterium]